MGELHTSRIVRSAVAVTLTAGLCWPIGLAAAGGDLNIRSAVVADASGEGGGNSVDVYEARVAVEDAVPADEIATETTSETFDSAQDVWEEPSELEGGSDDFAADVADGAGAAQDDAAVDVGADAADEAAGDVAVEGEASDDVAVEGETASQPSERYDVARILEQARAIDLAGFDALERYLADEELSDEALLSIDIEALADIDAGLADEIASLQDEARSRIESAGADGAEEAAPAQEDEQLSADEAAEASVDESDQEADDEEEASSKVEGAIPEEIVEAADESQNYPEWSYGGDTTLSSEGIIQNLTTRKFVALVGEQARELAAENDLYASVMIAQAILESGSGNSKLSQAPNFNLFGIKGAYNGQSVTMATQEDDGTGHYYTIEAAFRRYPSYRESLEDYAALMSRPFYLAAHKSMTSGYAEACSYLQGTYATSTGYAAVLVNIIEAYDLARYDEPIGYELVDSYEAVVDPRTGDQLGAGSAAVAAWSQVMADEEQAGVPAEERSAAVEQRGLGDLAAQAMGQLGSDYVWGATGPDAFDCSGLVQSSYATALGYELPRTTHYQCIVGEDVDFANLHTGDLVFFANAKNVVYHVGMYLGEGCYIESTVPGGVQVTAMEERMPTFAKRVLPTRDVELAEPTLDEQFKSTPGELVTKGRNVVCCIASRFDDRAEEIA